jgi:hypothetical protein
MKRAVVLVVALLASVFGGLVFNVSFANPYVPALNPANVELYLPEDIFYYPNSVPVSFTVESPYPSSWAITSVYGVKFFLDGDSCRNVRIPYTLEQGDNYVFNATLVGVFEGSHSLCVVAYVAYESRLRVLPDPSDGSGISNVVHFTMELPSQPADLEPFPEILIAGAVIVSAAVVSFGLVAYFLRRKSNRGNQT